MAAEHIREVPSAPKSPPETFSWGDILDMELPPERPMIEGIMGEETGGIWGGAPNVGKSFLTVAAARSIAAGSSFLGHFDTSQHTVLVVDEESHLRGIISRARMFEKAEPLGRDLPLHFAVGLGLRVDATPSAMAAVLQLEALIAKHRPGLVICDSLTRVHTANENSAPEMASVFYNVKQLMHAYGCSFLFTDHTRKKGLINDVEETLRGSTEKRAWADSIVAVEASDQGRDQLVVTHTKSRHGPRLDPFGVELAVDSGEGTARLTYTGAVTSSTVSKANDLLAGIHALQAQLGEDGADAARLAAWLDCSPATVTRHTKKLIAIGIITVRKATTGEKGGRPRDVFDVTGGRD